MTVAFDVGPVGPYPAGVGVYSSSLARALAAAEPANHIAFIGRRRDAVLELGGATVMDRTIGPYLVWVQRSAIRDALSVDAELVHFSDGVSPLRRRIPVILAVHDMSAATMLRSHPRRRWARTPLVVLSPRLARRIIVPSQATADEVMRVSHVEARRIVVSPYAPQHRVGPASPIEIERAVRRYGLSDGSFILALGTVEPRKNHVRLVRAFDRAIRSGSLPGDTELVIAGRLGWNYARVLAAIDEASVKQQIRILGFVDTEDLAGLTSAAMFAVYVSVYEGFGLPVVEALACGAPMLTSNVSSMPEVGGDAAFYADPLDIASIADGLAQVYEASRNRTSVRDRSLAQAARFSWQRAASEVMDTYADALSGSK